jgi:hypothetical protein
VPACAFDRSRGASAVQLQTSRVRPSCFYDSQAAVSCGVMSSIEAFLCTATGSCRVGEVACLLLMSDWLTPVEPTDRRANLR